MEPSLCLFLSSSVVVDIFVTILTEARDRYVPSTLPTTKQPTVWWNHFCQRTYCRKLQAWSRHD